MKNPFQPFSPSSSFCQWLAGLALIVVTAVAASRPLAAQDLSPASFRPGEASLQKLIEAPRSLAQSPVTVRCLGEVSKAGAFSHNFCFPDNPSHGRFVAAIINAGEKAVLQPAIVDGELAPVWLPYSVTFTSEGDGVAVNLQPNYGMNTESLGPDYSAAQGVAGPLPLSGEYCAHDTLLWLASSVGDDGKVSSVEAIRGRTNEGCPEFITQRALATRYIPAMTSGRAVPSMALTPLFFFDQALNRRGGYLNKEGVHFGHSKPNVPF